MLRALILIIGLLVSRASVAGCVAENCTQIQLAVVACGQVVVAPELLASLKRTNEGVDSEAERRRAEEAGVLVEGVIISSRPMRCPELGGSSEAAWAPANDPQQRRFFVPGDSSTTCKSFPVHKSITAMTSPACCDTPGSLVVPCAYGLQVLTGLATSGESQK